MGCLQVGTIGVHIIVDELEQEKSFCMLSFIFNPIAFSLLYEYEFDTRVMIEYLHIY